MGGPGVPGVTWTVVPTLAPFLGLTGPFRELSYRGLDQDVVLMGLVQKVLYERDVSPTESSTLYSGSPT